MLEKFTVNEVFTREGKDKKGKGKCMMFAHSFCFGKTYLPVGLYISEINLEKRKKSYVIRL